MDAILPDKNAQLFEDIKQIINGVECWDARQLMAVVGYSTWRDFEGAIQKAKISSTNFGIDVDKHFLSARSKSTGGRPGSNYLLTRTACYYVFQNGDPRKKEIANAQAYFILQTRKQEAQDRIGIESRRVLLRDKVISSTESLTHIATMAHHVTDVDSFHEAGNAGMYNMPTVEVEATKGIAPGRLLDNIDSAELAAHYFRTTQTEISLANDAYDGYVYDQEGAEEVAKSVGVSVRSAMREGGRTLPEDLAAVEDIEPVLERVNQYEKNLLEQPLKKSDQPPQSKVGPNDSEQTELFKLD